MLNEEEKQAIKNLKEITELAKEEIKNNNKNASAVLDIIDLKSLNTVLNLITKQQEQLELIKEYAHQEIVSYTETIRDYIDDDKEENKDYIGQLKEEREHWKDIEKILQNKSKEELYMNWWRYGLYE